MRKKAIWILVAIFSVVMTLFFSLDRIQLYIKETTIPNYIELTGIGYSEPQIKIINAQKTETLQEILSLDYQPDIEKILTLPHYAKLKDKGYTETDLAVILGADENIVIELEKSDYLGSWRDYLTQPLYRSILAAGYQETIAQTLFAMKEVDILSILKFGYKPDYVDLITSDDTVHSDLAVYLAYWQSHPALSLRELQEIINTENDRAKYTQVEQTDMSKGRLILVNKYFNVSSSFVPANLTTLSVCGKATLIREAANALRSMCAAMMADGLHPNVTSSYRSYAVQSILYKRYVAQDGKVQADTYSARPGYSEHQTGLVVDMIAVNSSLSTFKNTAEYKWMTTHAQDYGFILRYTQSKQSITGYIGEPWHWRYVGIETAKDYNAKKMTFDEYYRLYIE